MAFDGAGRVANFATGIDLGVGLVNPAFRGSLARVNGRCPTICTRPNFWLCYLSENDHKSLGLRAAPVHGWLPWIGASMKIGCVVAVCIVVGFAAEVCPTASTKSSLELRSICVTDSTSRRKFQPPVLSIAASSTAACEFCGAEIKE
jgi:hypothetical protein